MYFEHKELLKIPVFRAAYSDRTAWLMAEMSKLAYLKFEQADSKYEELKNVLNEANFELLKTFSNGGTQAFLAKREDDGIACLAFRGTEKEDIRDIIADLDARFYKNDKGEKIHNGFNLAFKIAEPEIRDALQNVGKCTPYVTGHSLGGALALIATKTFNSDNLAACYTFGSPKVGSSDFADTIKPPIYRIVNSIDPVPFLPYPDVWEFFISIFKNSQWKWLSNIMKKSEGYTHHGDMRYLTVCKEDFSDLRLIYNYNDNSRFAEFLKNKKIAVRNHAIEIYCRKLEAYAWDRLHQK